MLTFDVSASMAADDVSPTRMEAAKAAATDDRRAPAARCRRRRRRVQRRGSLGPDADLGSGAVLAAIGRLAPSRGTSLGQGILAALGAITQAESDTPRRLLQQSLGGAVRRRRRPSPPGSHGAAAIIVFSDGENNERPDPMGAAQIAADRGIRIQTIGVGTAAGTTLDLDGFKVQSASTRTLSARSRT